MINKTVFSSQSILIRKWEKCLLQNRVPLEHYDIEQMYYKLGQIFVNKGWCNFYYKIRRQALQNRIVFYYKLEQLLQSEVGISREGIYISSG